jgi:hypothetical protein
MEVELASLDNLNERTMNNDEDEGERTIIDDNDDQMD